jgi:uncharacterized protein (TIGR02996 family)
MSDRDAFLRAVADNPADDTVRLAFADWLDEHDDPDRARFIRWQIKRSRSKRESQDSRLPPRENALLQKHKSEWLGPLGNVLKHPGFEYTFRRGFVESAEICGSDLGKYSAALCRYCPALTELDVVGVRGFGPQIATGLPDSLRTLRLEDWPLPADAEAVAASRSLARVETLSVWIGSENDEAVCRTLASPGAFPALRGIELVQLYGGIDAFDRAAELDRSAEALAVLVNETRRSKVAHVKRPFAELLPLAPHVGWYLHGGRVPDGRQTLVRVIGTHCEVFYFDATGNLLSGENIDLSGALLKKPPYPGYDEEELFERLRERIGFVPGTIRVREFDAEQVLPSHTRIYKYDGNVVQFIENPDGELPPYSGSREEELDSVRFWYRSGNFCITHGGDAAWAGEDGTIHST